MRRLYMEYKDLTGQKFGKLTVIMRSYIDKGKHTRSLNGAS